jgi:thiol-disulfide isomerase/thioredoxin
MPGLTLIQRIPLPKSRNGRIALAAIVLVLLVSLLFWIRYHPRAGAVSFAPTYELTLKDYSGNDVRLSQYKREVLVVHAWATWCVYCADELKNLATLKKKYGDNIEILAPNRAESVYTAKPFTDALDLGETITFLLDPDDVFYKSIGGYAMPETLFINDRGEVFFHQRGPMNLVEVETKIGELIN